MNPAARLINEKQIGERTSDVNSDAFHAATPSFNFKQGFGFSVSSLGVLQDPHSLWSLDERNDFFADPLYLLKVSV
jgi:hypothetical protein